MATFSKLPLSQSTDGKSVVVSLSSTPGNLVHTAVNTTTGCDEVWLYAMNNTTYDSLLTIYWGGSANSDMIGKINIQAYTGTTLISPGLILNNSSPIYTSAQYPSAISLIGYVNRIS
jgi:hypothetical protein